MSRDGYVRIAGYLRAEEAEMLCGLLESAGIAALVEDAAIAGVNPFLQSAVGGAKVLVPAGDAELAAAIACESGVFPGDPAGHEAEIPAEEWGAGSAAEDPVPLLLPAREREALGRRALTAAAVGLLLAPTVVVPLFALAVAIRFWRTPGAATPRARASGWAALSLDVAALAIAGLAWGFVLPRLAPPPDASRWPTPVERTQQRPFP